MPKYKLAEYRYGREEMLALYIKDNKVGGKTLQSLSGMYESSQNKKTCNVSNVEEVICVKSDQPLSKHQHLYCS